MSSNADMNFNLPEELTDYLDRLDAFIEADIRPLERADDNIRFFDHRREWARTDFDRGGLPRPEWEALLAAREDLADKAGHYRFALPRKYGGDDGSDLWMAVIREHFAAKGLGLHNDLQNEHSIVGNLPFVDHARSVRAARAASNDRRQHHRQVSHHLRPDRAGARLRCDAYGNPRGALERNGVAGWLINGEKMWTTGMHVATHCALFARTGARRRRSWHHLLPGSGRRAWRPDRGVFCGPSTCRPIIRASASPMFSFRSTRCSARSAKVLALAQCFVHQNRIRQAASSLGAAVYCINESVSYARARKPFGQALADNQAIQWPLVELATQAEMLRLLDPQDGMGNGSDDAGRDRTQALRQGLDVQLLGEPALLRGRRPRNAGTRRYRLFAP